MYPIHGFKRRTADKYNPRLDQEGQSGEHDSLIRSFNTHSNHAILHAIKTGVDIISMSFSFEDEEPEIHQAIQQAMSKADTSILLFAAASNNRALRIEPIGYPAWDADHIMCVSSSTVDDEKSVFSPRGIIGRPNFSVIGEDDEAA